MLSDYSRSNLRLNLPPSLECSMRKFFVEKAAKMKEAATTIEAPETVVTEVTGIKPSDILKMMPKDRWCQGSYRLEDKDILKFCALGYLSFLLGERIPTFYLMQEKYGLTMEQSKIVTNINDLEGLD